MIENHKEDFNANLTFLHREVTRIYAKRANPYLKYILAVQCVGRHLNVPYVYF